MKDVGGAYTGQLKCPDVARFCTFYSQSQCPSNCNGRGYCVDGHCHCNYGYTGNECGLPSCDPACSLAN